MQKLLNENNHKLITAATPVMECLFALDNDCIIVLCEKEGYCIKSLHRYKNEISVSYVNYAEDKVGTCGPGLALKEKMPLVICGLEHLKTNWHSINSGNVPLLGINGEIMGLINMAYPFGKTPKMPLEILIKAGCLIQENFSRNTTDIVNSLLFTEFINLEQRNLLIVEKNGRIVNANKSFFEATSIRDKDSFLNKHLTKYVDKRTAAFLLSENLTKPLNSVFNLKANSELTSFKIQNHATIHGSNGIDYVLIVFHDKIITPATSKKEIMNISLYEMDEHSHQTIVGKSEPIIELKKTIKKVAKIGSTVLIQGESGTGKELIAHAIHAASSRNGLFVPVNCGAIPKELLESELFGYEEGTFTGAKKGGKAGKFETANGGTLFLDEIGEMPIDMQVALLRFLEDKTVIRMGSTKPLKVDVRIIAATNRNLVESISKNEFRQDLFYRLNVINIHLPPLREIKDDIPLLARHFLSIICKQFETSLFSLTDDAINYLTNYDWPGNTRELRNIIERAVAYSESENIDSGIIIQCLDRHSISSLQKYLNPDKTGREELLEMLERNNWNISCSFAR